MARLGNSVLDVFPLALGGNVFGWTADRETSFAILDQYAGGGGNFIDSADVYSAWIPGNSGGESETIIGEWLKTRTDLDVVIATKVAKHPDFPGLRPENIRRAADASLQRLQRDHIDLYYAHQDDPDTPLPEIIGAFDELVKAGKVRYLGLSNFTPERITEWANVATELGVDLPVASQPHYNLVEREPVESQEIPVLQQHGLSLVPYYGLASGFLTGKYRSSDTPEAGSPRAKGALKYATDAGLHLIGVLDEVAQGRGVAIATIALAWLKAQPTVAAPIASASRVEQVADLLAVDAVDLDAEELARIDEASRAV